jgi:arylsulfatase A-like enzyme
MKSHVRTFSEASAKHPLRHRLISLLFLLPCLLCLPWFSSSAAAPRPHIVYLVADDLGWKDVSFHGSEIQTPHLDALAAGGVELDQFYVQPICSPTRGALLTGRYPSRLGLQVGVVRPWAEHGLPLGERTLPGAMREAGYTTAIVGKWHLGHFQPAYLPTRRGFDRQYGHYNGALDYFTHERDGGLDWHRDDRPLREDPGYTTDLIGAEAVRLIRGHDAAKPLFLYVPFNAPHSPFQAPQPYLDRYAHLQPKNRAILAAMVACMDDAIGGIVKAVDERGWRERTLIVFHSDNGGVNGPSDNGPLRGAKDTLYEGGVRVVALANWPGTLPAGGKVRAPMHVVDMFPTLLGLAGGSTKGSKPLDGVDVWPAITKGAKRPSDEILINSNPFHGAIRVGDWKLVKNGDVRNNQTTRPATDTFELFNLVEDPYEKTDLAGKHPEKVADLRQRLKRYEDEAVKANIPPNRPPEGFKSPAIWGRVE